MFKTIYDPNEGTELETVRILTANPTQTRISYSQQNQNVAAGESPNRSHVLKLLDDYQKALQYCNKENRLQIEKIKLEHIQRFELNLKQDLRLPIFGLNPQERIDNHYKKALYYVLMTLGTINDAARNYMFGSALISLIPKLSPPMRIMLSILYIFFEATFFYAFEVALIREALGISDQKTDSSDYMSVNIEQARSITRINRLLVSIQVINMDGQLYENYQLVVTQLNCDLNIKLRFLQAYEESFSNKLIKSVVVGFGAITNIASSYYLFAAVLRAWAAKLLDTPTGWALILLAILVELGFYYAMGAASILRFMNTDHDNFNVLKNELMMFDQEHHLFFSTRIKKQETNTRHRLLQNVATQTDLTM